MGSCAAPRYPPQRLAPISARGATAPQLGAVRRCHCEAARLQWREAGAAFPPGDPGRARPRAHLAPREYFLAQPRKGSIRAVLLSEPPAQRRSCSPSRDHWAGGVPAVVQQRWCLIACPAPKPSYCIIIAMSLQAAFIHHVRDTPATKPFSARDGFRLCIDGARYLPDAATISRVAGRILDSSYCQYAAAPRPLQRDAPARTEPSREDAGTDPC